MDGDLYFVTWDERLIDIKQVPPADYAPPVYVADIEHKVIFLLYKYNLLVPLFFLLNAWF